MIAAFFDVDGTLYSGRVWGGLMEYWKTHGRRLDARLYFLRFAPHYVARKLKLISEERFRAPWAEHLAWPMRGWTAAQAQACFDWVALEYVRPLRREHVIARLHEHRVAVRGGVEIGIGVHDERRLAPQLEVHALQVAAGQRLDLGDTEPRLRLRVRRIERAGIGDEDDVVPAEGRPVHLVDGDAQARRFERAGGRASVGAGPLLEAVPAALKQRTSLIFGSRREVERLEQYYRDRNQRDFDAPLFGTRGLFRASAEL